MERKVVLKLLEEREPTCSDADIKLWFWVGQ